MNLKEFFVKIGLDLDDKEFTAVEKRIDEIRDGLIAFGKAAAAAGASLGAMVVSAANDAAAIQKLASLMGVSTDAAQELAFAAQRSGVDVKDMGELMSELSENIGEAAGGTGEAAEAFKALGIKTKDAKGNLRATDAVLLEIADKMATLPDGTKKTAALMGLFGEQGIALLPILNKGSGAIAELRQEARELGLVMDAETVARGAEASASMRDLLAILNSLKQSIAAPFIKQLTEVSKQFFEWYKLNQLLIKQRLARVFRAIFAVLRPLLAVLRAMVKVVGFVIDNFEALAALMGGILIAALIAQAKWHAILLASWIRLGAAAVAAGLRAAAAWVAASFPVIAIGVLLALIILLAQDIYAWLSGQDSLLGALWEKYKGFIRDWIQPSEDDGYLLSALKAIIRAIIDLPDTFDRALVAMAEGWNDLIQYMSDLFWGLIDGVVGGIKTALDYLPGVDFEDEPAGAVRSIRREIGASFGAGSSPASGAAVVGARTTAEGENRWKALLPTFKSEITVNGAQEPEEVAKQVVKAQEAQLGKAWRELVEGAL